MKIENNLSPEQITQVSEENHCVERGTNIEQVKDVENPTTFSSIHVLKVLVKQRNINVRIIATISKLYENLL